MIRILRSVGALLLGVGLILLGTGLFQTFLSLRMADEHFGQMTIGIIIAAYFAGFILGSSFGGLLVRRVGYIRAFAIFASGLSCTVLAQALIIAPIAWALLRLIGGAAAAGLYLITESWLNHRSDGDTRGQVLAAYIMVGLVATGLGQYLIDLSPPSGSGSFILTAALFILALIPVAASSAGAPPQAHRSSLSLARLFRLSPLGVIGSMSSGLFTGAFGGLGPLYVEGLGLGTNAVAEFISITVLGGFLLQLPVGRLSDRFDRRTVLLIVIIALTAISGALSVSAGFDFHLILALGLCYGGLTQVIYPVTVAHANDYIVADDRIAAAGGLILSYGIGATIGPLLGSAAMDWLGPGGLFVYITLVSAALALAIVIGMRQPALPSDQQTRFGLVSASTQIAAELDPRGHKTP